jgi:hypothetical protein
VRAVQAIFDDANYPRQGSGQPIPSNTLGDIFWDYPDGPWDPERNLREFLAALPDWRRSGILAFTVNLQGGGPPDGNYGEKRSPCNLTTTADSTSTETSSPPTPGGCARHRQSRQAGNGGHRRILLFRIERAHPDRPGRPLREGSHPPGVPFLKELPNRNVLIEINNEMNPRTYKHHILQPDGALDAVLLAQQTVDRQIPVSMSWSGGIMPRGSRGDAALRAVDYVHVPHQRTNPGGGSRDHPRHAPMDRLRAGP